METSRRIVVFDGDCALCSSCARWLERRVRRGVVVRPWQRIDLGALGLDEAACMRELQWVDSHTGARASGHRAVAMALRGCRWPWPIVGHVLGVPVVSWCARLVYQLVAANRHRLPGGTPACRLTDAPAGGDPSSR
ncbi:MAG: thiol-disulfide oxidoreductase DCC family protein [Actinomycetota bacterium]